MQNKCKVLYHPQTTLSTPEVWKNCLPPNQSLVPKRWGTTDVGDRNPIVYLSFNRLKEFGYRSCSWNKATTRDMCEEHGPGVLGETQCAPLSL